MRGEMLEHRVEAEGLDQKVIKIESIGLNVALKPSKMTLAVGHQGTHTNKPIPLIYSSFHTVCTKLYFLLMCHCQSVEGNKYQNLTLKHHSHDMDGETFHSDKHRFKQVATDTCNVAEAIQLK